MELAICTVLLLIVVRDLDGVQGIMLSGKTYFKRSEIESRYLLRLPGVVTCPNLCKILTF